MSKTFTPPAFGKFAKSSLFQDYSKDSLDYSVKLVSKTPAGQSFESAAIFENKKNPRGYIKTSFGLRGAVIDAEVHTDAAKSSKASASFKNVKLGAKALPGLNAGFSVTSVEKDFSKAPKYGFFLTANQDYSRNNFAATTAITTDGDSSVSVAASAAVGFEGFSVGGDVKLVRTDKAFEAKSYNVGAAYTRGLYTGALVSDAKFEKVKLTLLALKQGQDKNLTYGLQAKADLQASKPGAALQREVIVSVEQVATPNTTYKLAVVATSGDMIGEVSHKLANPQLTLTAGVVTRLPNSQFAPWPVSKFGVALTFGQQ